MSARSGRRRYSEAVPDLAGGDPRLRADDGAADPTVTAALAAFAAGTGSEHAVLTALAAARLLVAVMAVRADELADSEADRSPDAGRLPASGGQGEKATQMATATILGRDGSPALPAFTSLEAMSRWRRDARPVPVPATGVWQSAVDESQAVVIDIAGPVPLTVRGARLLALASGAPVPRLHEDPDVQAVVAAVAASQPAGIRIRLGPPDGAADFTLEFSPAEPTTGMPIATSIATAIAAEVAARLPGRLSKGIAVLLRAPAGAQ